MKEGFFSEGDAMLIEMSISTLAFDPTMNMPLVLLKNEDGSRMLPIWIGLLEASAIATKLENIELSRPMTHDLLKDMIESMGGKVEKIIITNIEDNTYFAKILLKIGDNELVFDARPSDSMALALRTGAKIFAEESVIEKSGKLEIKEGDLSNTEKEKWLEILENMDPDDFGKYKM